MLKQPTQRQKDRDAARIARKLLVEQTDQHNIHKHFRQTVWENLKAGDAADIATLGDAYIRSLNNKCIWDRTRYLEQELRRHQYRQIEQFSGDSIETVNLTGDAEGKNPVRLKPGQKFYVRRANSIIAVQIGHRPIEDGMNIAGAHIDSPSIVGRFRKVNGNYNITTLRCGVKGGLDPKDFFNIPMALHFQGVVKDKQGPYLTEFSIGEKKDDPIFSFAEQSFHLEEGNKPEIVDLEVIVGGIPFNYQKFDPAKRLILQFIRELYTRHKVTERDLDLGQICLVPANPPRWLGLDKSAVSGYGQDNWASAYALLYGFLNAKRPDYTKMAVWYDHEEIGDTGKGSLQHNFLEIYMTPALARLVNATDNAAETKMLQNTWSAFLDSTEPIHGFSADDHDFRDSAYMGSGAVIMPDSSDHNGQDGYRASVEMLNAMIRLLDEKKISYQFGIMGRPGNKIANSSQKFHLDDAEGIDLGVPVIGMHRSSEVASIADIWSLSHAMRAFFAVKEHAAYWPRPRK